MAALLVVLALITLTTPAPGNTPDSRSSEASVQVTARVITVSGGERIIDEARRLSEERRGFGILEEEILPGDPGIPAPDRYMEDGLIRLSVEEAAGTASDDPATDHADELPQRVLIEFVGS
jgi:hypothetical protein